MLQTVETEIICWGPDRRNQGLVMCNVRDPSDAGTRSRTSGAEVRG